jgi:hypothetical protein
MKINGIYTEQRFISRYAGMGRSFRRAFVINQAKIRAKITQNIYFFLLDAFALCLQFWLADVSASLLLISYLSHSFLQTNFIV